MPRLTRRLTVALLWLAVALLPLRGLATTLMPAMAAQVAAVAEASQPLPCHGAMSAASSDAATVEGHAESATVPAATGDCPTCSLCTLCHGSVAQASPPSLELPVLPATVPATARPAALAPRAPDALFRPPRSLLA